MDAAVDIRPTYAAMAFTAEVAPVRCLVGGQGPFALTWKQPTRVPVAPGVVIVVIWAGWITKKFMGASHAQLHVEPGQVVGLEWKLPQTVWGKGKMEAMALGSPIALGAAVTAETPSDPGPCMVSVPHPSQPLADVPLAAGAAAGAAAAAWHPDPTGRYPHRWWDGTRWTDSVSDGATTLSDPVPGL